MPNESRANFFEQPSDPGSLITVGRDFLNSYESNGFSPATLERYCTHIKHFICWCSQIEIFQASEINETVIQQYQFYLDSPDPITKKPLAERTCYRRLVAISHFLTWLSIKHYIPVNPLAKPVKLKAYWKLSSPRLNPFLPSLRIISTG